MLDNNLMHGCAICLLTLINVTYLCMFLIQYEILYHHNTLPEKSMLLLVISEHLQPAVTAQFHKIFSAGHLSISHIYNHVMSISLGLECMCT